MKRLLNTTLAALLGAAAFAHADGVVYQTSDAGFATAPAPVFVRGNRFQGPHVQTGVSIGIGTRRVVRPGVSVGISTTIGSSTRVTTRRTVRRSGAIIHQRTHYPNGYYSNGYSNHGVSTVQQGGDAQRRVGLRAESAARQKLSLIKSQVEAVGGALLEGGIGSAQVRWDGFNLEATSSVFATFVVPDSVQVNHGTPIAQGRFELVIPKSSARVPLACNEVVRLIRNPEGEQGTLLGALLRRAWTDARGKLTKTAKAKLQVVGSQGSMQLDFASFDAALGRRNLAQRVVGRNYDALPQLSARQVGLHADALKTALQARQSGDARHYQALLAQRAGQFGGAQAGLTQGVNSR